MPNPNQRLQSMNKFNFNHSLKNIPLPSKQQYQRILVEKIEKFVGNLRWKLFHIQNPGNHSKETFGFKSTNPPPPIKELLAFEEDLYKLTKDIEFRPVKNNFQNNLKAEIRKIHETQDVIIKADKSRNLYSVPIQQYNELLHNNITTEYKKTDDIHVKNVNKEASNIAKNIKLADRIDEYVQSDAFITIKDHKPNFPGRVQCRLLNPAKSNIGQISKSILEETVATIKTRTNYNQWKNSDQVISWFKALDNKENLTFLKFDIVSFYPSISEDLFYKALEWSKNFRNFSNQDLEILRNSRKAFLFNNGNPWVKKNDSDFDVTMGSFDGAEACELIGLFILDKLKNLIDPKHIGLYRDDGLAGIPGSGPQVEQKRKQVCKIFQSFGLKVTTETNLKQTDFLDIFFDLNSKTFKPFRKANDSPCYINVDSNHPRMIKHNLPQMIANRISRLSSSKQIYDQEIPTYKHALETAGHTKNIAFQDIPRNNRNRARNIIWFNPPYSESVKTNVGAKFLSLIDKHFKNSPLGRYFNRRTVKVSYSCLPNIGSIISGHNRKIISQHNQTQASQQQKCNCRNGPQSCPLQANCLQSSIIYKAKVETNNVESVYIGQAGNTFKERYGNHTSSFRNRKYETSTTLSKYIWSLKDSNTNFTLKWSPVITAPTYKPETRKCHLCNVEKTQILLSTENHLLNKRSELMNKCRHRLKHLLSSIT